jgi:1-acyl-sn-glycerol-3-phosphate acyltransferase
MFDILVVATLPITFRWISKVQVGRIPFLGAAMRAMNTYFVRRDHSAGDLEIMKQVEKGLREGYSVVVFPEGTRTRTGQLLPFKKGAFRISQNAGCLVVPIGIFGTFGIAPAGKLPVRWGHRVVINIGDAFQVPPGSIEKSVEIFRDRIVNLINEANTVNNP